MNDFKLDNAGKLVIENGDLVVSDSTRQQQKDILFAGKGWFHFAPTLGADLQSQLNETGSQNASRLLKLIRTELERDGMTIRSASISSQGLNLDAVYE